MTEEIFTNTFANFGKELFSTLDTMKGEIEHLQKEVARLDAELKTAKEKKESKYLFTNEACKLLKISESTLRTLWTNAHLERYRNFILSGNKNFFLRSELEALRDNVSCYNSEQRKTRR